MMEDQPGIKQAVIKTGNCIVAEISHINKEEELILLLTPLPSTPPKHTKIFNSTYFLVASTLSKGHIIHAKWKLFCY
jgi:hypothetical protein